MIDGRSMLLALCLKYNNDWQLVCRAIQNHEELTNEDWELYDSFQVPFITILDSEYPALLKQKPYPPFVLYYDGDINALSLIDKNDGKNDLIFVHGPNTFHVPTELLVTITDDNKVDIGGRLRIWFNDESNNVCRFGLVAGIAHTIALTKEITTRSWFNLTLMNAAELGANIYVVPTTHPSVNNNLIKDGANLLDRDEDLLSSNL